MGVQKAVVIVAKIYCIKEIPHTLHWDSRRDALKQDPTNWNLQLLKVKFIPKKSIWIWNTSGVLWQKQRTKITMERCFPWLTNQGRQRLLQLWWKGPESIGFRDGLWLCMHAKYTRSQQPASKPQKATEAMYYVSVLCCLHRGPGCPLYEAGKVEHKFQWSLQYTEYTMTTENLTRKAADTRWSSPKRLHMLIQHTWREELL